MGVDPASLAFIQQSGSQLPNWVVYLQAGADIFQKSLTGIGILAGGLFAYYRFVKGRTFATRVEPTISGAVSWSAGRTHLRVTANAKNIGLSRVGIDHGEEKTGLVVFVLRPGGDWVLFEGRLVFLEQDHLEPGQSVGEPFWFELPESDYVAIRLRLAVFPRPRRLLFFLRGRPWVAQEIVNVPPREDNRGEARLTLSNELKEGFKRWWSSSGATT